MISVMKDAKKLGIKGLATLITRKWYRNLGNPWDHFKDSKIGQIKTPTIQT